MENEKIKRNEEKEGGKKLNLAIIIGASIGFVALISLVLVLVFGGKSNDNAGNGKDGSENGGGSSEDGGNGLLNGDNYDPSGWDYN